jgi:hypothetical protein
MSQGGQPRYTKCECKDIITPPLNYHLIGWSYERLYYDKRGHAKIDTNPMKIVAMNLH